ncbi:hypothetical protein M9M90_00945 [Phenylobacterium sp. LH3H17]|uniref:hypothetical protein n=1 Tax=Phenylobacterium sp. LH3H17 TaxID=2903901 RepID=UPI0020C9C8C5|nr:hypothetical protein [Phenylobacterium sp. LH3H17]UTP39773.1 hypothetical protein M9M90_00945 [Phenylobacterium sp. LH3H17]
MADTNKPDHRADDDGRGSGLHKFSQFLEMTAAASAVALNGFLGWRLAEEPNEHIAVEIVFVTATANVVLLLFILFLSYSYTTKERKLRKSLIENARLETITNHSASVNAQISELRALISSRHAEYCVRLRAALINSHSVTDDEFLSYLNDVLGMTAQLFSSYTQNPSAACIKIFSPDATKATGAIAGGVPYHDVFTLQRDPHSRQMRRVTDEKYPVYHYSENAAFRSILEDDDYTDWFVENDLKGAGKQYWNKNKDYPRFYNACAVVPVKTYHRSVREECLGLLCVDNRFGGFDEDRCVHILNGIAGDLYYAMGTTAGLNGKTQEVKADV